MSLKWGKKLNFCSLQKKYYLELNMFAVEEFGLIAYTSINYSLQRFGKDLFEISREA